jgi:hypothetical protein
MVWLGYFLLSLLTGLMTGVNTLEGAMHTHWQFMDFALLRTEPLTALLQLHAQPPLLNGIVAVMLHLPFPVYAQFIVLNAACAATVAWSLMKICTTLLSTPRWAWLPGLVYLALPETILNAAYPFYPMLTAAGYAVMALALFMNPTRRGAILTFCAAAAWLTLLRSSFSWLHVLAYSGLFLAVHHRELPRAWTATCLAALLAVTVSIPIKNQVMYGFFGTTSWAPLNIAKAFDADLPLGYFPTPKELASSRGSATCKHPHGPADSQLTKVDGEDNFNHCLVVDYAGEVRQHLVTLYHLRDHLRRMRVHLERYVAAPDSYVFLTNRPAIGAYAEVVDTLLAPQHLWRASEQRWEDPLLVLLGLWLAWRLHDRRMMALSLILLSHMAFHTLTDGDEAQRFVIDVSWGFVLLAAWVIDLAWRARSGRAAQARSPDEVAEAVPTEASAASMRTLTRRVSGSSTQR